MLRYITRRLIQAIPTLIGITLISFVLIMSAPGDPVTMYSINPTATPELLDRLRRQLGFDQPIMTQYLYWLIGNDWTTIDVDGDGEGDIPGTRRGVLRGDFGVSLQYKRPVLDLIVERIPVTLQLTVPALVVGYTVGIPLGLLAALRQRTWIDQLTRVLSTVADSVPGFWLALLLIIVFSVQLRLLPMGGARDVTQAEGGFDLIDRVRHLILPVFVMSIGSITVITRYMRAQLLETLGQDYIRTARAKGLTARFVWWKHAMRNALIPIATFIGPAIGGLIGGSVIIEQVFSWPGMGRLLVNGALQRDYPLIMASVVIGAVLFIIGLLISDLLAGWLDPRIRLGG